MKTKLIEIVFYDSIKFSYVAIIKSLKI